MPPQHARASSPTLTDHSPSSSNSAHSVASSNSSTAVDSLHSLPRLHQPTVVRGSAGRLSFLPPPAQISPSGSTFSLHQPGKRRISETRSDGFLPRVYTDRGNHGSADNMGHFGFGSMEALGRVVERSSGAEVRGVGLPNPVGTTDNMGRMAFSSMESLVGVTDQGDMRGLPGGGTEKMGSSVESLHRLLERSTPAKGFAGREPEDPETAGGLGDIIDQQKPGGTPHVAKNRIMSVSRPDTKSAVDAVVHGEGSDPSCGQVDRGRSEVEIKEIGQVVDQQSPIVATNFAGTNQRSPGQTSPVDTHDERPSQVPPIIPQSAGFTDGFYTNGVSNEEIGSSTNLNTATGRSQNDSAQHPEASLDPPGMADAVSVSTVHQTPSDAETRDSMPAEDDRQHAKSQQESLGGSRAETNGDQDSGMTSQGAVQKMDQLAQHAVDEQALPVKESETNGEVNGLHLRGNRNLCEPDPDDLQELPDEDKVGSFSKPPYWRH